nr:probable receptor-like protein kinase At5g18500 [Ipomoea batatas]
MPARELELPEDSGYLKVPVEDIYSATNNLTSRIALVKGQQRKGVQGHFVDNQHVAVKHIIKDGCMETFLREVRSLTHIRHPNLVALLGYGTNDEECFLIYELCPNGNLAQWLFANIYCIVTEFSSTQKKISCILQPTNILLGKNLEAKLSDFGLSKVIDQGKSYASSEAKSITTREGSTFGFVDPRLHGEYSVEAFEATFALALACTAPTQQRPCIKEVVTKLEEALAISMKAKASSPQSTPQQSTLF